jgi:hypothetical protein
MTRPTWLTSGDVKPDIAAVNFQGNDISVFLGKGVGPACARCTAARRIGREVHVGARHYEVACPLL